MSASEREGRAPAVGELPGRLAPARIGIPAHEVETPALLVDLDALEANMGAVHRRALGAGVRVRPHAKAHKSPDLARLQLATGARGICCQKLAEAEVFAAAGIDDILVTNQVVGVSKALRAARLASRIRLGLCVDHPLHVEQLAAACAGLGASVDVYVELDVGQGRCGVMTSEQAVELAAAVAAHSPALQLAGLHAYHGGAQHLRDPAERAAVIAGAVERVRTTLAAFAAHGLPCDSVTGGGSGTFHLEAASGIYTEVQPGSYVLMDADYAANQPSAEMPPLRQALFGWCSVVSRRAGQAVLDGGLKCFATDHGLPQVLLPGWRVSSLSDEHTVILADAQGATPLSVGDKVRLVPGHCDPTVNLHDWLVAVRGGTVSALWPVAARGAML